MKKWILTALVALCLLLTAAQAVPPEAELSVSALVGDEEICTVEAAGETYLFLPGDADATKLTLCVALNGAEQSDVTITGECGSVRVNGTLDLYKVTRDDGTGRFPVTVRTGGVEQSVTLMVGEGLPTVYLHSDRADEDRAWVDADKTHKTTGSLLLIDANGATVYSGALTQIKARGNSTFREYPKKAYQIKLGGKADLLGTGEKVKTWVLLANYGDATMQHDKLFKTLAAELGMEYTASSGWVNLYYDGEYRGVYLLSEKVSVGSTGVNITDMEELYEASDSSYGANVVTVEGANQYGNTFVYTDGLAEPENITGGWLIERNVGFLDEVNGFYTAQGAAFNIKNPEWAGKAAMEYISSYYQKFEDAVFAVDENGNYTGINPVTDKSFDKYVDMESLVKVFLLQELALNPDGFLSSFYFYKDMEEIMYAGPIWDQDMTLGTGWTKYISYTVTDYHYLQAGLIKIPAFRAALEEYFTLTFLPTVEQWLGADGAIARNYDLLKDSVAMNYTLWPYVRIGDPSNVGHLWAEGTTFEGVTKDMSLWVKKRLNVLRELYYDADYAPAYTDVDADSGLYTAVSFAAGRGLMQGTGGGQFSPERTVDCATLYTVLARLDGADTTSVPGEAWYAPGMNWAAACGFPADDPHAAVPGEWLISALRQILGESNSDCGISDREETLQAEPSVTRAELAQILFELLY